MRALTTILVAVLLFGCGDCSDGEGSTDVGIDARAARDVGNPNSQQDSGGDAGVVDLGRLNDVGDCTPLRITHEPPTTLIIGGPLEIVAQVEPMAAAAVLHWRRANEADFAAVDMIEQGGSWLVSIPADVMTFAGIDYFLEFSFGRCHASSGTSDDPHHVEVFGEFRISQAEGQYEYTPDVWERKIVYSLEEAGGLSDDIVLFDLDTLRAEKLTDDGRSQGTPRVWGKNVVFVDNYGGDPEIGLFDTETRTAHRVTNNDAGQYGLEIDRHVIVWRDDRNMGGAFNGDIYGYDLGPDMTYGTADDRGELELVSRSRDQTAPRVHVDDTGRVRVVYASMYDDTDGACDASCDWNIYLVDFGEDGVWGTNDDIGPVQLTSEPNEQQSPVIWGTRIAWLDARGGNWLDPDIWWLDLGPDGIFGTADDTAEQELAVPVNDPDNLAIWQDRLVWEDYRTMGFEIYLWDFTMSGETPLTDVMGGQFYPEIWDNVVVWQDTRNNAPAEFDDDVYVRVLPRQ